MNSRMSTAMVGVGQALVACPPARVRAHAARRRPTLALRIALACGGVRGTYPDRIRMTAETVRRVAYAASVIGLILVAETVLALLSR